MPRDGPANLCRFWAKSCLILRSTDVRHSIFRILPPAIFISTRSNRSGQIKNAFINKGHSQWKRKHIQSSALARQDFTRHGGCSTVKQKVKKEKLGSLAKAIRSSCSTGVSTISPRKIREHAQP